MSYQPSQADIARSRVAYFTQVEFLTNHNVLDDADGVTRKDIEDAVTRLTPAEREVLTERLQENRRRLTDLMDGDRKQFDEPHVVEDDVIETDANYWRNQ
jgi:hypothetical protein